MNNIDQYHPLPIIIQASVMFYSYFTLPLQCFVAMELIDDTFRPLLPICVTQRDYVYLLLSRITLMAVCLAVALLIPQFSVVVGLIGSVTGSMIGVILPALFYVTLRTQKQNGFMMKGVLFVVAGVGCVSAVVGVYAAVRAVVLGL